MTLVRSLGGEQLYGNNKTVPLRELIQNASDAVRARRIVDNRDQAYGSIYVRIGKDSNGHWIEVEDNGVGMSSDVLKGPLLDFGTSFWGSHLMFKEFPGLLSKGFESTGKYGIGFFSVFMWGDRVRVTSRSYKDAQRDTKVLEFNRGINSRPILRVADETEFIRDGGTRIRVWVGKDPESFEGLFDLGDQEKSKTVEDLCKWLCPSIDVDLYVQRENQEAELIISAWDWIDIEGNELLKRIESNRFIKRRRGRDVIREQDLSELYQRYSKNLRLLRDESGKIIGRACISGHRFGREEHPSGLVTVGGFRSCDLSGITGILVGVSSRAARDLGIPVVGMSELGRWASDQADLVFSLTKEQKFLSKCAEFIRVCYGYTGKLPIAEGTGGWLSAEDICCWKNVPDEVLLVQDAAISLKREKCNSLVLNNNVLAVAKGYPGVLQPDRVHQFTFWPKISDGPLGFHQGTLKGAVIEALAKAWDASLEDILRVSKFSTDDVSIKREVGICNGKSIVGWVDIIKNPTNIKETV